MSIIKRRQMHPAWTRDLDKVEITSAIISTLTRFSPHPAEDTAPARGKEWLQRNLREQDFEAKSSGDGYSLNPWTLDMVISVLIESGVETSKPSVDDAIHILRRSIENALRRRPSNRPWRLLAGTKTLGKLSEHKDLLTRVEEALIDEQQRDGSWRISHPGAFGDSGEWTLQAIRFLVSQKPLFRKRVVGAIRVSFHLRDFVAASLHENDELTRGVFLTRFEEVGIREDQPVEHLLFASFVYSILEQFYWVTSDFDPQSEFLALILQIGRLERVGLQAYLDQSAVRRALFRSQALRDQASARKGEVAHSISLLAEFLTRGKEQSFREFTLALRKFIFEKATEVEVGWKRDILLGELLRLEVKGKEDPVTLAGSLERALKCLPGVGDKVSSLFLYYTGHIFRIWSDLPRELLDVPIDWNLVKPYSMLGFSTVPLEQLKKRPQVATGSIHETARELFKDDPAELYGLWVVGQKWCARPWMCRDKTGNYCWLYAQCPYPQSRR